jgi:hypothetical protein
LPLGQKNSPKARRTNAASAGQSHRGLNDLPIRVDALDFDLLATDFVPDRLDGGASKLAKHPLRKT